MLCAQCSTGLFSIHSLHSFKLEAIIVQFPQPPSLSKAKHNPLTFLKPFLKIPKAKQKKKAISELGAITNL